MPQVKNKTLKDGWYVNQAKNADGSPAPLSLGAIMTMKPGARKFFQAQMVMQSRATYQAFVAALDNGSLVAEGAPAPEPKKPEPKVEQTVAEVHEVKPPEPVDQSLTKDDLKSMSKSDLIAMAEGMSLDTDGTKAEIIDRILVSQE